MVLEELDAGLPPGGIEKAMLDLALKVSQSSYAVEEADFEALAAQGFSEEDAWDVVSISAFFAMSNRIANAADLRPNAEFHAMGRG